MKNHLENSNDPLFKPRDRHAIRDLRVCKSSLASLRGDGGTLDDSAYAASLRFSEASSYTALAQLL